MLSFLGDIVCTSIIEIIEIFRVLVRLLKILLYWLHYKKSVVVETDFPCIYTI